MYDKIRDTKWHVEIDFRPEDETPTTRRDRARSGVPTRVRDRASDDAYRNPKDGSRADDR